MISNEKLLDKTISESKKILIISHFKADADAIASCLLVEEILKTYYRKKPTIRLQSPISDYVQGIKYIRFPKKILIPSAKNISWNRYDAVIFVDGQRLNSFFPDLKINDFKSLKKIVIDHHNTKPDFKTDVFINEGKVSATEQIYLTFKNILGNKINSNKKIAKYTQIGIITDSGNFMYEKISGETYNIMGSLRESFKIDAIPMAKATLIIRRESINILTEILGNIRFYKDLCYTYISKKTAHSNEVKRADLGSASTTFIDNMMRYIEGVNWGFILKPDSNDPKKYTISMRAIVGTHKVNRICQRLGGGGHNYSGGASIQAENEKEAIEKVLSVIKNKG